MFVLCFCCYHHIDADLLITSEVCAVQSTESSCEIMVFCDETAGILRYGQHMYFSAIPRLAYERLLCVSVVPAACRDCIQKKSRTSDSCEVGYAWLSSIHVGVFASVYFTVENTSNMPVCRCSILLLAPASWSNL